MAKRLIPLLDRILVEKLSPPAKSIGGVLLPDAAGKVMTDVLQAVCNTRRVLRGNMPSTTNIFGKPATAAVSYSCNRSTKARCWRLGLVEEV